MSGLPFDECDGGMYHTGAVWCLKDRRAAEQRRALVRMTLRWPIDPGKKECRFVEV
jgi:hypothetical protein